MTAAQTGIQAKAAAAAYEGAFDATVPPAVIAANRALLATLIATNFLGQNTPAIAATEALYMEMWFQDGLTMDTYSLVSQAAASLPPQTAAPAVSDGGTSANTAAAAQSTADSTTTLLTDVETLLESYIGFAPSGDTTTTGWTSVLGDLGITGTVQADLAAAWLASSTANSSSAVLLPTQAHLLRRDVRQHARQDVDQHEQLDAGQPGDAGEQPGDIGQRLAILVESKIQLGRGAWPARCGGSGRSISAQLASARRMGGLSIPNGWADRRRRRWFVPPHVAGRRVAPPQLPRRCPTARTPKP